MDTDKENLLFERHPQLFRHRELPMVESLMCFGFECGNGWFDLLDSLATEIDALAKKAGWEGENYPAAEQVKEKFGTLRFYVSVPGEPEEFYNQVYEEIGKYENRSAETCEICGEPGRVSSTNYWLKCRCEKHQRERT